MPPVPFAQVVFETMLDSAKQAAREGSLVEAWVRSAWAAAPDLMLLLGEEQLQRIVLDAWRVN